MHALRLAAAALGYLALSAVMMVLIPYIARVVIVLCVATGLL